MIELTDHRGFIEEDAVIENRAQYDAKCLFRNYILFCTLYAVAHGTVNVVLAFAAAELGITLAAMGGFAIYFGFTLSSLLFAKPFISNFGSKLGLVSAISCFVVYVGLFCISLMFTKLASTLFILGACIGGVGEGLMWTSQGIYYSLNSVEYFYSLSAEEQLESDMTLSKSMSNFAAIFAILYLSIEAGCKIASSVLFSIVNATNDQHDSKENDSHSIYRVILFAFYTCAVLLSAVLCYIFIIDFKDENSHVKNTNNNHNQKSIPDTKGTAITITTTLTHTYNTLHNDVDDCYDVNSNSSSSNNSTRKRSHSRDIECSGKHSSGSSASSTAATTAKSTDSHIPLNAANDSHNTYTGSSSLAWRQLLFQDSISVISALSRNRLLQYITPFQVCFGMGGVFMDSYINGVIVKNYTGEQYIGVLSGILSISSVMVILPYAYVSNRFQYGKYYIMMFGCACFAVIGLPLLLFSNSAVGRWDFIIWLYIVHGCARGVWENTNKAVLGEYFAASYDNKSDSDKSDNNKSDTADSAGEISGDNSSENNCDNISHSAANSINFSHSHSSICGPITTAGGGTDHSAVYYDVDCGYSDHVAHIPAVATDGTRNKGYSKHCDSTGRNTDDKMHDIGLFDSTNGDDTDNTSKNTCDISGSNSDSYCKNNTPNIRDAAFASVSFSSSLGGAFGYLCFNYFTRTQLALLNICVALCAMLCYHLSYVYHSKNSGNGGRGNCSEDSINSDKRHRGSNGSGIGRQGSVKYSGVSDSSTHNGTALHDYDEEDSGGGDEFVVFSDHHGDAL